LIALFGVSCQNGVILVSLVKHLQEGGYSLRESIFRSALIRMKPALMTSTVAMAGLLPAALSTGIGAQSQRPIAIVIVGGLLPSMALALIVLPALYEWIERRFGPESKDSTGAFKALEFNQDRADESADTARSRESKVIRDKE
jgi:cobalt-zinc-cadmium resistance protein CzcA